MRPRGLRLLGRCLMPVVSVLVVLGLAIGAPASGANAAAGLQQQPRFEASVNRVRVNVIVTDSEGRFVEDLSADDFQVYEDGELREGIEVQLVDHPPDRWTGHAGKG